MFRLIRTKTYLFMSLGVFFFPAESEQDGEAIALLHSQDEKHVSYTALDALETSVSLSLSCLLQKCSGQQSTIDTYPLSVFTLRNTNCLYNIGDGPCCVSPSISNPDLIWSSRLDVKTSTGC